MARKVEQDVVAKGRAHFPEPIVEEIAPPKSVIQHTGGYMKGLSHEDISALCKAAEAEGFARGAVVVVPQKNYISADVYNWGVITAMNYAKPAGGDYPGPVTVTWPFKGTNKEKIETRHFIDELYLVYTAPTRKEQDDMTKEMKEQFKR